VQTATPKKATGGVTPVAAITKKARARFFCDEIAAVPSSFFVATNHGINTAQRGRALFGADNFSVSSWHFCRLQIAAATPGVSCYLQGESNCCYDFVTGRTFSVETLDGPRANALFADFGDVVGTTL